MSLEVNAISPHFPQIERIFLSVTLAHLLSSSLLREPALVVVTKSQPSFCQHFANILVSVRHSQIPSQKFPPLTFKTLTLGVTFVTMWPMEEQKVTHSIKIKLSILRKGKVAAVSANKSLGQWLEEAILEKIDREQELNKEGRG